MASKADSSLLAPSTTQVSIQSRSNNPRVNLRLQYGITVVRHVALRKKENKYCKYCKEDLEDLTVLPTVKICVCISKESIKLISSLVQIEFK